MAEEARKRRWPAIAVVVLGLWFLVRGGAGGHGGEPAGTARLTTTATPGRSATPTAGAASGTAGPGTASPSPKAADSDYAPGRFAAPVRTHAARAGVDPQLLMAILYIESYKPHGPEVERAWQRLKPDAAFGIANMHRAAFEEARQGRDFAGRAWEDLPDDPDLAVEAAAWHLHDLAAQLPAHWSGPYTKDELMALGYNTGAGNMLAFARNVPPGAAARSYLDRLHDNWAKAAESLRP
ncbi:transglycosylase SLT domain-containing protein [Kitasatospora sp. RG8]|uniref:transglycosylase SLT domain-containing protein n=1 Tax=Kitasatospora sp. RG8 TaxID=2820815 RepID=UPI001ADF42E9|nr:transglycosylase SLT domain-containing protein [Kitasatospora sp. RG8]MBP0448969.1 transglycosylase SLT domain-containing protein [Kitasatospora sp. RG8]